MDFPVNAEGEGREGRQGEEKSLPSPRPSPIRWEREKLQPVPRQQRTCRSGTTENNSPSSHRMGCKDRAHSGRVCGDMVDTFCAHQVDGAVGFWVCRRSSSLMTCVKNTIWITPSIWPGR